LNEIKKITANKEIRTLRALFERAVRYGYMESNPARRCNILKIDQCAPQILTTEQFNHLLTFIKEKEFRDIVTFAILTAMRAGEVVFLEWSDLDMLGRVIAVRNKPAHRVKMGKERLVPMGAAVYTILNRLERKGERVFYRPDGQPYSVKLVSDKFRKYRQQAGLPEGIHFHSLRHSSLTMMHYNGVPSESLRQIAGHSSIQTTHLYTHALPYQLLDAVNTLNKNITPMLPGHIIE
jgi:integrase